MIHILVSKSKRGFMFISLVLLSLSLLSGCKPERMDLDLPLDQAAVVWKYDKGFNKGLVSNNFIYSDLMIQGLGSSNADYKVVALSLDSGYLRWESAGFPAFFNAFEPECSFLSRNKLIITYRSYTRAINAENGETLWEDDLHKGDFGVCVIDDFVYKTALYSDHCELYRYNILSGNRELIFTVTKQNHGDEKFQPVLRMPVKWIDPDGNEFLIIHSRGYSGNSYRMDVMSWNVKGDSMEWYHK